MKDLRWDLLLLLLLSAASQSNSSSPPGKPVLLSCRSPEKETFTCWWRPGSDGGLLTTHRLHYEREGLEGKHECPDYQSAGRNSCFFDRSHTSIWVDYYLTVTASNALGDSTSDVLKIDVMEILRPNPPENVTLLLVEDREDSPHLRVSWERPHNTDTRSGWATMKYELRVKHGNSNKWREYTSGTQTHFSLYSLGPGAEYVVQVRCSLDHSSWSEWSITSRVEIPNYLQNQTPLWVLVSALFLVPSIAAAFVLVLKRKNLKRCVLPNVPAPRIRGVDFQLLKSGPSEDFIKALNQNFPRMVASKDQSEDYLIVTENDSRRPLDPFSSGRRKTSFPSGFCLHSEIQRKDSVLELNETNLSNVKSSQEQQSPSQTLSHHTAFTNSDYVDVQGREDETRLQYGRVREADRILYLEKENGYMDVQRREEDTSEGYSRVREVDSDSTLILQTQRASSDASCQEKSDCYVDFTFKKTERPLLTPPGKVCTQLFAGGYVETFPQTSVM